MERMRKRWRLPIGERPEDGFNDQEAVPIGASMTRRTRRRSPGGRRRRRGSRTTRVTAHGSAVARGPRTTRRRRRAAQARSRRRSRASDVTSRPDGATRLLEILAPAAALATGRRAAGAPPPGSMGGRATGLGERRRGGSGTADQIERERDSMQEEGEGMWQCLCRSSIGHCYPQVWPLLFSSVFCHSFFFSVTLFIPRERPAYTELGPFKQNREISRTPSVQKQVYFFIFIGLSRIQYYLIPYLLLWRE